MIRTLTCIFFASATPIVADAPFLGMPLDCTLGETCVIEDYPDTDPSDGMSDYRCGLKSRDGHSGTDFALLSFEQMDQGVRVIAAADGRVQATRDMRPDQPYIPGTDLQGQDCGNAVRIDHGNGYQSVYCHLKLGSVLVSPGQRVLAGQVLGEVGLSGRTNYPHLHLTITQGNDVVDPFAPDQNNACGEPFETLWRDTPTYTDAGLFTAAVSSSVPDLEDVQSGVARRATLSPNEAMVLYGYAFHGNSGDVIELQMTGPDGLVFDHTARLDADQARLFRAFGRRPPSIGWPTGAYRGTVTLIRGETILAVRHADVTVN
ncbi:M23 family metallopeptidase [Marivita sp. S6314]|uniref:M23 family metallopeptidase n=1 Tax=Marivita sp. S6314 TaxID=2926406 RepID=UPI001FF63E01|nr:M23 family metallopeptidase [Marivita sp. S6314]MCK0150239.1 M23 family metallopeptidase [Marivita sp. S6314]